MLNLPVLLTCLLVQEPRLEITARVQEAELRRFATGSITVRVEVDEAQAAAWGWDREPNDARPAHTRPLIQLDVPASIELVGAPAESLVRPADYARFFLDYPFGRHMPASVVEIPYRRLRRPGPEETVGINLTAFLGAGEEARFVRRRLELALAPGSEAVPGSPGHTRWGRGRRAVGDALPSVTLPALGGGELDPLELIAEGELLLFTYRAHW